MYIEKEIERNLELEPIYDERINGRIESQINKRII